MELKLPKGTRDFPPEEKIIRDKIVETLKEVFELYGFSPLETPAFERYEILASKYAGGSEILKETFKLKDQGNRELGLRYDLTVPLSRFIGMNPNMKMPFKRYQIGPVFRDGPVESARYRQFLQCDVDVVGSKSIAADAEIVELTFKAFEKLGLKVIIKVNNRKLLNDILDFCSIDKKKQESAILSIDKLEKFGLKTVKAELKRQKIDEKTINKIINTINIKGSNNQKLSKLKKLLKDSEGLKEIEQLLDNLKNLNCEVDFDVSLARGLSYYTGTVAETFLKNNSIKTSVCGGGRYDNMIGSFLGRGDFPAVGVSFGVDRIYDALLEKEKSKQKTKTQVYVIPIGTLKESMKIAQRLRKEGINADIDLMGRGISKNLKYANSMNIPYVIFIGEDELKQKKVKLKDMESGKEEMIEITQIIKKMLP